MLFCMLYNIFNATSVEIANSTEKIKNIKKYLTLFFKGGIIYLVVNKRQ